jgi:hypothetical protein
MNEIVVNLHMHSPYSDGTGSHHQMALAALRCNLDAIIVTDHNVWIGGMQRYFREGGRRLLVLVGEEIHDRRRLPQKDHLLVLGAGRELAPCGHDTAALIGAIRNSGGLSFIAHPVDPAAPAFREPDISWENWSVLGFTGLELWNGFSELKFHIPTRLHGLFYAHFPTLLAHGPALEAVAHWDRLLTKGPVVALGGSDAHALRMRAGLLRRTVFPYEYHFRCVNTHVLLQAPLTGSAEDDARTIYAALAAGRCFIGYDLPKSTCGFRFYAHGAHEETTIGGRISARAGVALHAKVPDNAEIRLLKDGHLVQTVHRGQALTYRATEAGVYRIEAYRRFLGRRRAWIFSNPIYVR